MIIIGVESSEKVGNYLVKYTVDVDSSWSDKAFEIATSIYLRRYVQNDISSISLLCSDDVKFYPIRIQHKLYKDDIINRMSLNSEYYNFDVEGVWPEDIFQIDYLFKKDGKLFTKREYREYSAIMKDEYTHVTIYNINNQEPLRVVIREAKL